MRREIPASPASRLTLYAIGSLHRFPPETNGVRVRLKKLMWEKVGIVRNRKDLSSALAQLREWDRIDETSCS